MHLAKTIVRLRKQKGLTQVQLAALLDVHPSVVTRWERGLAQPRSKALDKLANILEISVQELMAGDLNGFSARLSTLGDPELLEMFGQVDKLDDRERDALKVFLGAILTRAQMAEVIHR